MAEARRLGEIAGPMLDRLHAQRERLSWVVESSEAWVLLTPVVRFQWQRVVFLLALGPWRVGVSWRRYA